MKLIATSASVDYLESAHIIFIGFALLTCCIAGIALTRWRHRRYAAMLIFVGIVLAVGVHPIGDPSPLMSGPPHSCTHASPRDAARSRAARWAARRCAGVTDSCTVRRTA